MPASGQLRCPQCQSSLSSLHLGSPFRWPQSGLTRNFSTFGIECPSCGAKLRITQGRLAVAWGILVVAFFFGVRSLASIGRLAHLDTADRLQLLWAVGAFIGILLLPLFAQNLWQVHVMSADEAATISFPLGTPKAEEDAEPGWVCPKCHEKNPENFELCWKCEHARPKAGI